MNTDNLMKKCPGFNTCSAPKCPLDSEMKRRVRWKGEPFCNARKSTILKIVKGKEKYLPWLMNKFWWAAFKASKHRERNLKNKNKNYGSKFKRRAN